MTRKGTPLALEEALLRCTEKGVWQPSGRSEMKSFTGLMKRKREEIAKSNAVNFNLPNCIAIGDGTLLPLHFEPQSQDAPDCSGRKRQCSLSVMVTNDDQRRIRCHLGGHPGTAHDSRVHNATRLAKDPMAHFGSK